MLLRALLLALAVFALAAPVQASSTYWNLPAAQQPVGTVPDAVPMDQGTGCPSGPCNTVQTPSLRLGQPLVTNCSLIASPFQYQECFNTSTTPTTLEVYIGTTWTPLLDVSGITGIVSGPSSTLLGCPALWNNLTGTLLKDSANSFNTCIVGADQRPSYFGNPVMIVGTGSGTQNALVGEVTNNLSSPTLALPVGVSGYGQEESQGNTVFGLYGVAEERTTTGGVAIAAELTARNFSGHAPDLNLPPDYAIGTTSFPVNGLNVTAGTETGTMDDSIGVNVSNESGQIADPVFNTGLFISLFRQYGLFVGDPDFEAPTRTDVATSAVIQNNGYGINLQLQTTQTMQADNAVVTVVDKNGTSHFSVRQNGDIYGEKAILTGYLQLPVTDTSSLPGCASGGGGTNHMIAYCNGTQWVVH